MYARTITIDARPENIDAGIAYVRDEVFDAVTRLRGCVGMSMVADRESGRCIATTAWDSEEALRESDRPMQPARQRGGEIFGGPVQVNYWELALMHRDHPSPEGACVRSTWVQGDPADTDRAIDVFKLGTLPAIEQLEGFCSASLLVDRTNGRAISTVTYDSRAALEATREAANAVRASATADPQMTIQDIREFDLVLAHLHVPELV